jgi:hypothetical protein
MAGLGPAIHAITINEAAFAFVDARPKAGHDAEKTAICSTLDARERLSARFAESNSMRARDAGSPNLIFNAGGPASYARRFLSFTSRIFGGLVSL